MSSAADHQLYISTKINPILEAMVTQLLLDRPEEPVPFMITWLTNYAHESGVKVQGGGGASSAEAQKLKNEIASLKGYIKELEAKNGGGAADEDDEEEEEDEDDDVVNDLPDIKKDPPKQFARGPRQSVSAEAYGKYNQKKEFTPPVFPKSEEQKKRIRGVLEHSFLFNALDDKDLQTVIMAMEEKNLPPKTRIIQQGDDGDSLYVIESGEADCYKKFKGEDKEKVVKTCQAGDYFGELALLYNCPRAASVECKSQCVVWRLDRDTFNAIVKDAAAKKRELYDSFLKKVPLLESLDTYERNQIADALRTEHFKAGDSVVRQGDPGDKFYIIEEGEAVATKAFVPGQDPREVFHYKAGDYFGELALIKNEPRAANVVAKSNLTCAVMDRRSFKRLLGSLDDILRRNTSRYN